MGRSYTGSIRAAGYAVPLPQGKWTVVADQTSKISSTHGAGSGRWLYLAKIVDHRLMGVVHVLALRRTTGTLASLNEASLPPATCEPTKPDDPGHWKCATVGYNYLGHWAQWSDQSAHLNSSERAAAGELTVKGIAIPQDFMAVRMWRSEEGGALFTEYMFNPEEAGIGSCPGWWCSWMVAEPLA